MNSFDTPLFQYTILLNPDFGCCINLPLSLVDNRITGKISIIPVFCQV